MNEKSQATRQGHAEALSFAKGILSLESIKTESLQLSLIWHPFDDADLLFAK
jgi:hypothetical protein